MVISRWTWDRCAGGADGEAGCPFRGRYPSPLLWRRREPNNERQGCSQAAFVLAFSRVGLSAVPFRFEPDLRVVRLTYRRGNLKGPSEPRRRKNGSQLALFGRSQIRSRKWVQPAAYQCAYAFDHARPHAQSSSPAEADGDPQERVRARDARRRCTLHFRAARGPEERAAMGACCGGPGPRRNDRRRKRHRPRHACRRSGACQGVRPFSSKDLGEWDS